METVLCLAFALLQTPAPATLRGIAARHPGDAGSAQDPAVLFASDFEQGFEGWASVNTKIATPRREATRTHTGAAFARLRATRGVDTGGKFAFRLPQGVERLHLRFKCRFDRDTCWSRHDVKRIGPRTPRPRAQGAGGSGQ